MQVIVMTSNVSDWTLGGFAYTFNKYWGKEQPVTVCGFRKPPLPLPNNFDNFIIGPFRDYPADKWSDAFKLVLKKKAEEVFLLLLDDYWLTRKVDVAGMLMLNDYAYQFKNVLKIDTARDRLNADTGRYLFNANDYNHCGHLDLIKSPPGSDYQLSLWGGFFRRDNLDRVLIPGERAQEIELRGTSRVNDYGEDGPLVLGTRQGPLMHGNVLQSGQDGLVLEHGGWHINKDDLDAIRHTIPPHFQAG